MNHRVFVGRPLEAIGASIGSDASGRTEPGLPNAFRFDDETLMVKMLLRTWRTNVDDRGDTYVKRHWFEFVIDDGRRAVVYFERNVRRRNAPRWWLYTIESGASS